MGSMDPIDSLQLIGVGLTLAGSVLLFAAGDTVPALMALTLAVVTGFSFTQWRKTK